MKNRLLKYILGIDTLEIKIKQLKEEIEIYRQIIDELPEHIKVKAVTNINTRLKEKIAAEQRKRK